MDSSKVTTVREWGQPTIPTEVRSFLGLAGYYHRFIKGFSKIADPLTNLTHKGVPSIWNDHCQLVFDELKDKLTLVPMLALPRKGVEYFVFTDRDL